MSENNHSMHHGKPADNQVVEHDHHKMIENAPAEEHDHHLMMENEFKRHFIISLIFTIPVLVMSPTVQ